MDAQVICLLMFMVSRFFSSYHTIKLSPEYRVDFVLIFFEVTTYRYSRISVATGMCCSYCDVTL